MLRMRTLLVSAAAALTIACSGNPLDPRTATRIAFDLRSLALSLEGDASTVASVTLGVGLPGVDGDILTRTTQISPTDSIVVFELSLSEGPYRFSASAISNNNETLYQGSVTQFVDGSDPVVLNLDAVHGVFVAGPANVPESASIRLRNVGIFPVTWTIRCSSARISCQNFYPTSTGGQLLPGQQDSVDFIPIGGADTLAVEFTTTVGVVTVQKAIEEAQQPAR